MIAGTSRKARRVFAVMAMLTAAPCSAHEETPDTPRASEPMIFGAASSFSQGFRPAVYDAARRLPLKHYRSGIRWADVERERGVYDFSRVRRGYPDLLHADGAEIILTLNGGNPLYDNGHTPHSPEALEAFSSFVAAVVERYPAIVAIEVGNEINGVNFVSGPVLDAGVAERGRYHLAIVRAAREGAHAVRPDLPVYGGSTHSLPAGFLWPILDAGAPWLDGLAVHPYTTQIDQMAGQFSVLRQHPAASAMPIAITEWGSPSRTMASHDMLRGYATFAALGVEALYWYPLSDRGDGLVPLVERDGSITRAGETYRLIQNTLGERTAEDVSPDTFTFAIRFGDDRMVLWGEPRALTVLREDIAAFDAHGTVLDKEALRLLADHPILLQSDQPFALADMQLGCSALVADSFYQFSYDPEDAAPDGWQVAIDDGAGQRPFTLMPGQERSGAPWNPYLGDPDVGALRLTAQTLRPVQRRGRVFAIRHSFTAPTAMTLRLEADMRVRGSASGEMHLTLTTPDSVSGVTETVSRDIAIDQDIALAAGEQITLSVAPAEGERSVGARYRFRLHDRSACAAAGMQENAPASLR